METPSHIKQLFIQHKKAVIFSAIAILIVIIALISIILYSQPQQSYQSNANDSSWNGNVPLSEDLITILDEDYSIYANQAVSEALNEYFLSLYPSGTGINFVREDIVDDTHFLRLISSYGSFHTLSVTMNAESTIVKLDEAFEKTYPFVYPEREDFSEESEAINE